jgi:hypothetical protein
MNYEIKGTQFSTLDGFFEEAWQVLVGERRQTDFTYLDAFHDIMSWPTSPYVLVWSDSEVSRQCLGHSEIAKKLDEMLQHCHPSNVQDVAQRLERARRAEGPTMFDWLVEIIRDNSEFLTLRLE